VTRQWAIWEDHASRFSWLKAATLLVLLWPGAILLAQFFAGALGGRPITELIHGVGDWTVRFLLATLAVTPLRAVWDWPRVLLLRRMLGVGTACYALAHFTLYCIDSKWRLGFVASEIALRFYLTIGFVALLGLVALAVTSTDGWQKSLGRRWKALHRLVFPIAALALFHYFLQSKADVTNAVFATGVFAWLAFWRLAPRRWQGRLALPLALAVLAPLATALVETAWYGLATGVQAARVLAANLDFDLALGLRPSGNVLVLALAVLAVAAVRRLWKRRGQPAAKAMRPARG
jgi:sulfoxide reductase heme-binding subunit YedZ